MGAAYFTGQQVGVDPLSPDFGSVRVGNTAYNLWGTDVVLARTIARAISNEGHSRSVTLPDGTVQEVKWPTSDKRQILAYLRSGANPLLGDIISLAEGENIVGEEISLKTSEGRRNLAESQGPLHFQDIMDIKEQDGIVQALLSIPLVELGMSGSSYNPATPSRVVDLMPKYKDIPVDKQWEIWDFLQEIEPEYQKAKAVNENIKKADFIEFMGVDTGREELGKLAAADYRNEIPLNPARIDYAIEHAKELDARDLGWSVPLDMARFFYNSGEWDEALFDKYLAGRAE
jgi:hypothetical protein